MNIHLSFKLQLLVTLFFFNIGIFAAPLFTPDSQPTGWVSSPATSSSNLNSNNEVFYQIDYSPDFSSGDTKARDISNQALVQSTGPWDNVDPTLTTAATKLETLVAGTGYDLARKIVTFDGTTKIPFRWTSLSPTQQASIGDATIGPKILNFVRGDRSNEGSNGEEFRAREPSVGIMGATKHSAPVYRKHLGGEERVYAGANDGMLHVFDALTGAEVFAYVPSMIIRKLNLLITKPTVLTHFVDGPTSIENVNYPVAPLVRTILVGALGAGGKGLYALDVTTPTAADEDAAKSKLKWEISEASTGFGDLGHTYGTPKMARLNNGTAVVIIGNGYVNNGNGNAILYVINLDTGALISAIDTGSGDATDTNNTDGINGNPNGLSTPTLVDTNSDGKVEFAYAGDIDGNLWKFDLSADPMTSSLVFTTSPAQAITVAPVIKDHPHGGTMVVIATGQMLSTGDDTNTDVHYAYGIWDGAPDANNQLLTQTLAAHTYTYTTAATTVLNIPVRTITANVPDWSAGSGHHKGWKVALPAGERTLGEAPFTSDGRYYFLSTNPTVINSEPPNGANYINELDIITGGSPSAPIFDLNQDHTINSSDLPGTCTAATFITCIPVSKYLGSGVVSQPILINAQGFSTTVFTFHPDLPSDPDGTVITPPDPGISGGHFDFDIYYYDVGDADTVVTPTTDSQTGTICEKTKDIQKNIIRLLIKPVLIILIFQLILCIYQTIA